MRTVRTDQQSDRAVRSWDDDDFALDDLEYPATKQWQRCGAVHCIDRGPWIGTLVCCIRQSGHDDDHSMSLGDADGPDYWLESWH